LLFPLLLLLLSPLLLLLLPLLLLLLLLLLCTVVLLSHTVHLDGHLHCADVDCQHDGVVDGKAEAAACSSGRRLAATAYDVLYV
jgi:hypothetical protein